MIDTHGKMTRVQLLQDSWAELSYKPHIRFTNHQSISQDSYKIQQLDMFTLSDLLESGRTFSSPWYFLEISSGFNHRSYSHFQIRWSLGECFLLHYEEFFRIQPPVIFTLNDAVSRKICYSLFVITRVKCDIFSTLLKLNSLIPIAFNEGPYTMG